MQQEMGTKTSISLFQQQETTTSKQSKSKSDGNAGLCQALSLLEPAPSQRYTKIQSYNSIQETQTQVLHRTPALSGQGNQHPLRL